MATIQTLLTRKQSLSLIKDSLVRDSTFPADNYGIKRGSMNKLFLTFVLVAASFNAFAQDSRCQSGTICTYSKMPLMRQSDPKFTQFVANRIGQNPATYKDPGLCATTAGSMAVSAIMLEKAPATGTSSALLARWNSMTTENSAYLLGQQIKTDFVKGGTKTRDLYDGYKAFFKFARASKFQLSSEGTGFWDNLFDKYDEYPLQSLINGIKSNKHVLQASMIATVKKEKKVLWTTIKWNEPGSGHSVVINGFDGNRLKVFDPWGAMYPIITQVESVKLNPLWSQKATTVTSVGAAQGFSPVGFVGNETKGKGNYVILSGFVKADAY